MAKKIVTLYVDDTSIRLLETRGKRIKKAVELPLEPGWMEGAVVIKADEIAAKVKQLFKEQKMSTKKVIVGLSGLLCLTRAITLPHLPRAMLPEAVTREAKRVLPLATGEFYISWSTISASRAKTQVFLVAVRRRSADALLKTLHQAGLKPYAMDIKSLALSRLVKEPTAVIIDVQPTEFDVIIMGSGIPHPIRTVAFPSQALSWQDKYNKIRDDVDTTIKFYNSNNLGEPITSKVSIYVSGELFHQPELCKLLSDELGGNPVLPLLSPLKPPKSQIDYSRYMVNAGLALKESSLKKSAGPSCATANLLPAAYQPKPISWVRVAMVPSMVIIIGMLIPTVMMVQGASDNTLSIQNQLDITNKLLNEKQLEKQKLREDVAELEKKLAEAEASRNAFTSVLEDLDRWGNEIDGNLGTIIGVLPPDVRLTGINHSSGTLTVNGIAPGQTDVLWYAQNLANSARFSEVIVASIRNNGSRGMSFTLNLKAKVSR